MLDFIQIQIIFYITLAFVLFLPGYFFLLACFGKQKKFSRLEEFVISFGLSILIVDFLMLLLNRFGIGFTSLTLLISLFLFCAICYAIFRQFQLGKNVPEISVFSFSKNQVFLIIVLLFLSVFIRTAYLKNNIFPSSTDLGHHMYWAKIISQTGQVPDYAARDIVKAGENYSLSQPMPISDFIIGEHLIFSAINLISGVDFISYFPVIVLHLINLMGVLVIFILALKLFENHPKSKLIAILSLLFVGPLFAVSPPQAKYVGGGVIGNLLGNLLLPLALYFHYRTFREKRSSFLALALICSMVIFYTHHLTGLLFLLILALSVLATLIFHSRELLSFARSWTKIIFSPAVIATAIFAVFFVFTVYTPTYITNKAVSRVLSEPAKIEHQGLSFGEFKFTLGEPRIAAGIAGIFMLLLLMRSLYREKNYELAILASWAFFTAIISLKPAWLDLNIPSARVANYGIYPFSIIGAFALVNILARIKSKTTSLFMDKKFLFPVLLLIAVFLLTSGFFDSSQYAAENNDAQAVLQTFDASEYLAEKSSPSDRIIADHIYLVSDAWIKLFFARDYNFPFYRANLDRYSNGIDKKEFCTLWMISVPESADSQKCYADLGIDFVFINEIFDSPQFEKSRNFSKVYDNGTAGIYYRPQIN